MKKQLKVHPRSSGKASQPVVAVKRKRNRGRTGWSALSRRFWPLVLLCSLKVLEASVSFLEEGERWRPEYSPGRGAPAGMDSRVLLEQRR